MTRSRAAVLLLSLAAASSCRKAEPDEIVTPPLFGPAAGGSFGVGGTGSGGAGGTAATAGNGSPGGDSGTGTSPVECEQAPAIVEGPFTKANLLEASARCAMSHYCRFTERAQALRDATRALAQQRSDETVGAAKNAWMAAISSWQEAEPFRFGPAAPSGETGEPGGQDLRALIYSWPLDTRCKVDEQTESRFYTSPDFFGSATISRVNGRSLAALEYLIFYGNADNGCSRYSHINATGAWNAIPVDELMTRKAEYAAAAAEDVLSNAIRLIEAWQPGKGNFHDQLVHAGAGSTVFESEQQALNAVNVGLFYLEKQLKDDKLGVPLGLSDECPATSCPERIESRYARVSTDHLRANLRGFRRLFQGCGEGYEGIGFDDWLRQVGGADLAEQMLAALDTAESAVEALDPPLEQSITAHPERVRAVYDAVSGVSELLKTQFVTILNLELPGDSIGDND